VRADLARAATILRAGGVIAYATEYCFGLGCDPLNRAAVLKLLRLKSRPMFKGLIVLAASEVQLAPYVADIPANVRATWPGPHTWLLPVKPGVPGWITGAPDKIGGLRDTRAPLRVAVRVTAHPQAAALCRAAGMAIVSTSANRAGEAPARTDREVARRFGKLIDYILPGRVGDSPAPTPIRDALTGQLVRPG
jgi:L-threonylcarbamoyladenylate synthase